LIAQVLLVQPEQQALQVLPGLLVLMELQELQV
jgi:hypothetical protein